MPLKEKEKTLKLTELFSTEDLELELQDGYVKEQKHPFLPLTILNYTDKTTYEGYWTRVTTHCRGLIVNNVTDEIVARGPRKFFNYGEPSAPEYPLDTLVRVTRKEDGSLGIVWRYLSNDMSNEFYGIATRGSFSSEQAVHANGLITRDDEQNIHYAHSSTEGYSRVWEIVYPENRIVLDYGETDKLIPLGTVNNRTGLIEWRPSSVLVNGHPAVMTLAEAIALPIPDDEEGYVLDILDEYLNVVDHLKLKGAKYKELHSAIFGLTERKLYDLWVEGQEAEFIEELPDELQPWALEVVFRLDHEWHDLMDEVHEAFDCVPFGERREQAQYILETHKEIAPALFALLDNNIEKCHAWIDKQIKPGHVPFKINKETAIV